MTEEMETSKAEANVLSPKGRFNRTKFSFWASAFLALPRMLSGGYPVGIFIFPITFIFYIFAIIKRLKDINISPWWALIAWVPVLNLPLLFIPGTLGENKYGAPPKNPTVIEKIMAIIMPLAFAGIVAAALIPEYQENYEYYKNRAEQQKRNP